MSDTLCLTLQLRLVEAYPVVLAWTAHISIPFPLKLLWCAWGTRPLHSVRQPLEQFEMILEFYWHLFDDVDDGGFHLFFGRHMYKDNSTLSCWNHIRLWIFGWWVALCGSCLSRIKPQFFGVQTHNSSGCARSLRHADTALCRCTAQ